MKTRDIIFHFDLHIDGDVPPCPRPKVTRQGIVYYPKTYRDFKAQQTFLLSMQWKGKKPISRAIEIDLFFLCTKPKNKIRKKTQDDRFPRYRARGDLDNMIKSVLDVCEDANIFVNDNLIFKITAQAWYAGVNEKSKTTIKITEVIKAKWTK